MTPLEKYCNSRLHRKCIYCAYYHSYARTAVMQTVYFQECMCKKIDIRFPRMHRFFCSCFTLNKKQCAEVDEFANRLSMEIHKNEKEK